jgi:6,7-dimethyl-8-ribityllumazine synthase
VKNMGKGILNQMQPIPDLTAHQVVGALDASGMRFAVVVSRFNQELTFELCRSATACLLEKGASSETIDVFQVPGAYEIPAVLEKLATSGRYNALIALGVVVEGETQHAQMIIDTTGQTILDISCRHQLPVINEIVGVRTWEQAEARCLGGKNTRGWYAAEAAIETAQLYRQLV